MDLVDRMDPRPVREHSVVFSGAVWDVVRDVVDLGPAGEVTREFIRHPGAVAVVALDEDERVVLLHQYRHPTATVEWEIPAGLRDVHGEAPVVTAARELAEEADLTADTWHHLIEVTTSPGSSTELITVFLARGLHPVAETDRHVREGEEQGMAVERFPLAEVRSAVFSGRVRNATLAVAVLAACASREEGWSSLRPA